MPKFKLPADFGQIFLLCLCQPKELLSQGMTTLTAHFDGKVLIPDEPVNLPVDCALELHVEPVKKSPTEANPLKSLVELAKRFPVLDGAADGAAQHDHYLYGLPKRP